LTAHRNLLAAAIALMLIAAAGSAAYAEQSQNIRYEYKLEEGE